jgi:hypothetical protein
MGSLRRLHKDYRPIIFRGHDTYLLESCHPLWTSQLGTLTWHLVATYLIHYPTIQFDELIEVTEGICVGSEYVGDNVHFKRLKEGKMSQFTMMK